MVLPDLLRTRFRLEQHLLQGRVDHGGAEDDLEEDEPESLERGPTAVSCTSDVGSGAQLNAPRGQRWRART